MNVLKKICLKWIKYKNNNQYNYESKKGLVIMTKKELWEMFKKTGKIEYYLEYKKKWYSERSRRFYY